MRSREIYSESLILVGEVGPDIEDVRELRIRRVGNTDHIQFLGGSDGDSVIAHFTCGPNGVVRELEVSGTSRLPVRS